MDSRFLTRVVLENYKSIASCDVALGPLMFLVGPNASGKSNFLDALRFVADALGNSLDHALRSRGGGGEICHYPNKSNGRFGMRLEFLLPSGDHGHYAFRIGAPNGASSPGRWEVLDEEWSVYPPEEKTQASILFSLRGGNVMTTSGNPPVWVNDRLALVNAPATMRPLYHALTGMRFYQILRGSIETFSTFEPGEVLEETGRNLASVLSRMRFAAGDVKKRVDEYLGIILPGLVKTRVEPVFNEGNMPIDAQKIALLFEQKLSRTVESFWPSQMSDGTVRALAILVALLQAIDPQGPCPVVVGIEEPEVQLHPAALGALLDAITEASLGTQVIVTTHSPDLLDNNDVSVDSILAVTAEQGETRIGPVDEAGRTVLRDRLFTVGELLSLNQLSPGTAPINNGAQKSPHLFNVGSD
jgi:predicted ATPase